MLTDYRRDSPFAAIQSETFSLTHFKGTRKKSVPNKKLNSMSANGMPSVNVAIRLNSALHFVQRENRIYRVITD